MNEGETVMERGPARILVAIDGSEAAGIGLDFVANVAWPPGTAIVVAMAVETGPDLFGGPWPAIAMIQTTRIEAEVLADAERMVGEARDRLTRPGLSVEAAVLRGRAATAIVEKARDVRADLIVVGSRGHGTIESMVLGSVSAEVVDHAPTPVLVARGDQTKRVLLAWDGSACATRAAALLLSLPLFTESVVRVVSVAGTEVPWWAGFPIDGSAELLPLFDEAASASREHHAELARKMSTELDTAGLRAEPDAREGDAATELLAAARSWPADLIVIGTHGRTGITRFVLGSVARNVLQHATCSVLIARENPASVT